MYKSTLNPNMFNAVNFFVNEFGKINQQNAIVNEPTKECIESYINTFLSAHLIKTKDSIMAREHYIRDLDDNKVAVIYFVTGMSIDPLNDVEALTTYASGIIKMESYTIPKYIILEDYMYSILMNPHSYITPNSEMDTSLTELNYIGKQSNSFFNYMNFFAYEIGPLLKWNTRSDNSRYALAIDNDNSFMYNGSYSFISFFYCLFLEMLKRALLKIHNYYDNGEDFDKNIMIPFAYSLSVDYMKKQKIDNYTDRKYVMEYAKTCLDIGNKIGEINDENSYLSPPKYSSARLEIMKYTIEKVSDFIINLSKEEEK